MRQPQTTLCTSPTRQNTLATKHDIIVKFKFTFGTTHFSALNLTDGGPRQGHYTLEQNDKRNARAELSTRHP